VRAWLALVPPTEVPDDLAQSWQERRLPDVATMRRTARQHKREQVRRLDQQGLSYVAIAAEVGVHRVTVSTWLKETVAASPEPPEQVNASPTPAQPAPLASPEASVPPPPWESWDTVRQVREGLQEQRYLLVRRPAHLSAYQQRQVDELLSSPAGTELQMARRFVSEWYLLWHDKEGQRRTLEEARTRFAA
jgi:transposase-like protein